VPFIAVLGKREVEGRAVALRRRGEDLGAKPLNEALELVSKEAAMPVVG